MARQILPIAGQIAGGMIGGPIGAAIGGAIGSAVGAYVDPIRHQGPRLGEARMQTAQEGGYRPLVFGTGCVSGNVIHRSERKVVRHRERVGKGGRDTVDSDRGYRTFAIRIAEAHTPEGYALLRIWENETLVYDVRPESEIPDESAEYAQRFRFYAGTEDQLPDPDLEAYLGVGNVNSYRGSCYIVFGNFDLTDYGDMVPQYRFEIAGGVATTKAGWVMTASRVTGPFQRGHQIWVSSDLASWDGPHERKPDPIDYPTYGPVRLKSGLLIAGSGPIIEQSNDLDFEDGLEVGRVNTGMPDIGRIRSFGDIVIAFPVTGGVDQRYWTREGDDGAWVARQPPGDSLVDVARLDSGRWVSVVSDLENTRFIYSDDPGAPVSWSDAEMVGDNVANSKGSIACNGKVAAFLGTNGRIATTQSGAVWVHSENLPLPRSGGRDASQFGERLIIAHEGVSNGVTIGDPSGASWVQVDEPLFGFQVERIAQGPEAIVVSYPSGNQFGDDIIHAAVSYDGGGGWSVLDTPAQGTLDRARIEYYHAVVSADRVTLAAIIEFCHRRVGQPPGDFDVTELVDEADGVVFADGYTARDAIMTLLPIYNADASEHDRGSGYRINYIKRGAPVVRTLTADDLVDEPEETVREDPMERPRVLHMAFESPVTGYTAAKASIQRLSPDVKLVNEVSTYVPVTFKDVNEAWQRADVQMRVAWTEVHGERTFSISDDQLDVVPTDVLALSLRGQVQRLRVLKVEYADGVLKLETVADRQSNYTSNVTGIPLPAPEKPPPSLMGPAAFAILDIPAISDQHDRLGYYVAVCGTTEAYAGAVIQRQQNGEWADVVRLGRSQRAIMGVLENTVFAASEHYTDTTNTVSVVLYMDDELESLSDVQWLSEGGAFALETESGWEVMQYRDAYQDSEGVWHLTHLARGRLNTAPAEHQPGSRFVLLDGVRFIDATVGMIGQPLTLRAAAVGRSPETAVPETITYQGNSQREFPVAHLFADLDGDDLSLQATPRDRFGTDDHPVRSINHDGFRWSATDGSSTVSLDTDHATATLDVSGLSTPITVTVAQVNRFTGAGPTVSEQVE